MKEKRAQMLQEGQHQALLSQSVWGFVHHEKVRHKATSDLYGGEREEEPLRRQKQMCTWKADRWVNE